jgi:large subunit ribosomal protein L18Ae
MYKEYRAPTINNAVSQMYIEMSGRHQARPETIQIIRHSVVANKDVKRGATIQFAARNCRFPKTDNRKRAPLAAFKSIFKADRPILA